MSLQKTFLPLCSGLVLGVMVAGEANADGSAVTSAKFNCGTTATLGDVVPGEYATSINIHNPQQSQAVQFTKTIVQAFQEGSGSSGKSFSQTDTLQPGQAEFVDCPVIYTDLNVTPGTQIEGFVEIDILNSSYGNEFLDVVGKYTAAPAGGQVSAMDIVVYSPLNIGH